MEKELTTVEAVRRYGHGGAFYRGLAADGQGQVVYQLVADPQTVFEALDRLREEVNQRFRESHEKEVE